jgi:type IV pilus assembly protein PilA
MFIWLNKRLNDDERGFTLIELMVVVLIIAILIAIAIPTFLGARRRAQDRQAQSNVRNALTAEKTHYADSQQYTDSVTSLRAIESNLNWGDVQASSRGVLVEDIGNDTSTNADFNQGVILRSLSKSGTLFCIGDMQQDFTYTGQLTAVDADFVNKAGTFYNMVEDATGTTVCPTTGWEVTTDLGWS